jgi:hypothetical protein
VATGGGDGGLRLWDAASGTETCRVAALANPIHRLAFAAGGRLLAAAGTDEAVRVWDLAGTTSAPQVFPAPSGGLVVPFALSLDGRLLAMRGAVWDRVIGKERYRLPGGVDPGHFRYAFSDDGCTLAVSGGASIRLCEAATGRELHRLTGHRGHVYLLDFSRDGRRLLSLEGTTAGFSARSERQIRIWDVVTGKELSFDRTHRLRATSAALSPDGRTVALVREWEGGKPREENRVVTLWEVATGTERCRFAGHREAVTAVGFSTDGRQLVTASADTTALVWDTTAPPGSPVAPFPLSDDQLEALWAELGDADAGKAFPAQSALLASPGRAVPFLRGRLQVADPVGPAALERLLADLGSDSFASRARAEQVLERLGERAATALRRALDAKPPLDVCRRAERLLARLDGPVTDPDRLRELRGVEVLELLGTPAARRVLEDLARGAPEARRTREATEALGRLGRRPGG